MAINVLIYPSLQQPVPYTGNADENAARWYKQWADPVDTRKVSAQRQIALIASGMAPIDAKWDNPAEQIFADKWWQQWRERLYPKRGLAAYLHPFHTDLTPAAPFEETIYIDKYLYPFSLPVWHKARLEVGDQPFFAAEPEPEDQDFMAWFRPMSEPKRFPKRLEPGQNPAFTTGAHNLGTPFVRAYIIC